MAANALLVPDKSDQPIQFTHNLSTILTTDTYLLWKTRVLTVLRGHGLIGYVDGSLSPPPTTISCTGGPETTNPTFTQWHRQDQLILDWLFNSISAPILMQVVNCSTTSELWAKLLEFHTSESLAHVMEIKLKMQTAKKGNVSCAQYLRYMQSLAEHLRSVGSKISEKDLIFHTLQGLSSEYGNFVTAIATRRDPVTMAELQNLLFAHEAWLQANLQTITSPNLSTVPQGTRTLSWQKPWSI